MGLQGLPRRCSLCCSLLWLPKLPHWPVAPSSVSQALTVRSSSLSQTLPLPQYGDPGESPGLTWIIQDHL